MSGAVSALPENSVTSNQTQLGVLVPVGIDLQSADVVLSGPDAGLFELVSGVLYLRAGVALDYEVQPRLDVRVAATSNTDSTRVASFDYTLWVTNTNDAPTLSSVATLEGLMEDQFNEIAYSDLIAAADEADEDGDALSFRIETISSGTLQKWNVANNAWEAVVAGSTLLSSGEKLRWQGDANANGTLDAFTVKAWDGALASGASVQVRVETSATPLPTAYVSSMGVSDDTANTLLYETNYSGNLSDGATTDDTSLTFSGSFSGTIDTAAGELIQVFDGNVLVGTATLAGVTNGTWSLSASGLGMAKYAFNARVVNTLLGTSSTKFGASSGNDLDISVGGLAAPMVEAGTGLATFGDRARYVLVRYEEAGGIWPFVYEIQSFVNGINVALGKTVTTNLVVGTGGSLARIVDGISTFQENLAPGRNQNVWWVEVD